MRPRGDVLAPMVSSGFWIGLGMGALLEGIVMSSMLQWHHVLSSAVPLVDARAMRLNLVADGAFLGFGCVLIAMGIARLWDAGLRSDVAWSAPALGGGIAMGAGAMVVLEGVVFHHLLELHHVRPGHAALSWDLAVLAIGAALIAVGAWTVDQRERALVHHLEGAPA